MFNRLTNENKRPRPENGFTLLEILIAIFIFAILISTLFGSYRSVFSKSETIDRDMELNEMGQNCLQRMILDLESTYISLPPAYRPPDLNSPKDPYRFVGDATVSGNATFSRLRFASTAHLSFQPDRREGISEIVYYVQPEMDGRYVLKRSDILYPSLFFEKKKIDPVLCRGIKSYQLKFYGQDNDLYDLWDSESEEFGYETPRAVSIKLELMNRSNPHVFETMVILPAGRKKGE